MNLLFVDSITYTDDDILQDEIGCSLCKLTMQDGIMKSPKMASGSNQFHGKKMTLPFI